MDAVEILLSCVVGFSVSVTLILGYIEESSRKTTLPHSEENIVGADGGGGNTEQLAPAESKKAENSNGEKDGVFDDDLDWEGIERTELERVFGEALVFVSTGGDDDRIRRDLKLELYGLSKIALDGPCCISQPGPFKLSARSKWNAWRRHESRGGDGEVYLHIVKGNTWLEEGRYDFQPY